MTFVRKLAEHPRYAGTEGEKDAYNLISEEFERLGCEVAKEETEYVKSDLFITVISLVVPWLFLVFVVASWMVHPLTLALIIVAAALFMSKVFPMLMLDLAKDKSVNVIATMNPQEKNRLIICGHYDSARVMSKFAQKYRRAFMNLQPLFILAFVAYVIMLFAKGIYTFTVEAFNIGSLADLTPRMTGAWAVVWWTYVALFVPFLILVTYGYGTSILAKGLSYGADDNASGIAVMMETARRLEDRKPNLRVDFACFAAEEKGLFGSTKWVNKHLNELDREHTYVFNIDCVSRGEKFFVYKGLGTAFKKNSDAMLCNIVADACSKLNFALEENWGGNSDHAEFVAKGFRTCAISRFDPMKVNLAQATIRKLFRVPLKNDVVPYTDWIHTEDDTVDKVDERKLEETVQLVVAFVEELNQKVQQT